jgi:hypothetical protein
MPPTADVATLAFGASPQSFRSAKRDFEARPEYLAGNPLGPMAEVFTGTSRLVVAEEGFASQRWPH